MAKHGCFYRNALRLFSINYLLIAFLALLTSGCQLPISKKPAEPEKPKSPPCVTLALPESGNFAPITKKIVKGAQIAGENLKKAGVDVRLEQINTEAPDWLAAASKLSPECAIIGGPLQESKYVAARKAGLLQQKIIFAFTPNLMAGDEGKTAWRFFPGPDDQVEALIKFATDDLNIRSFGALYPDDNYGRKMVEVFEKALQKQHMALHTAAYNPSEPATWSTAAKILIQPITAEDGSTQIPRTAFEAIFLPESWKKVDGLYNSLVYNGEDRLILLGPMLWEQSLAGKKAAGMNKFALAVFPGAWKESAAPGALKNANADFWVALGYDFVNFAVNSGIDGSLPAGAITKAAQKGQSAIRALAPMRWNDAGIASQNLYLFQIGPTGMTPLNREDFLQKRAAINEKSALRMQGLLPQNEPEPSVNAPVTTQVSTPSPIDSPEPTGSTVTVTPAPVPAQPGSPALSTVPIPSYKLRLPTPQQ